MNIEKWLKAHAEDLSGKTVAVTGSTGGLGQALCTYLVRLGARLILLDRNPARSEAHKNRLLAEMPSAKIACIPLDLADIDSVKAATETLKADSPDVLIHNAGAYSIPRHICKTGYENVFQINFASPYYMVKELLPALRVRKGRVVAVGSIAHRYSKTDEGDVDFRTRPAASHVYGNAKRYLMFALYELFRNEKDVTLAVTHPGITFTGITAHYPKVVFAVIKHPMKVIFMKPRKAALSLLAGFFDGTAYGEWIGPCAFDVWGYPKKKRLQSVKSAESACIAKTAEAVYEKCKNPNYDLQKEI